jgi:hypothetical protein
MSRLIKIDLETIHKLEIKSFGDLIGIAVQNALGIHFALGKGKLFNSPQGGLEAPFGCCLDV